MVLTPKPNVDRVRHQIKPPWLGGSFPAASRGVLEMKKLFFGVLFAGLLAACGGNNNQPPHITLDSGSDGSGSSGDPCNVLMQTGCANGEKCTWIVDQTMPQPLGHIGCAPD